MGFQGSSGGEGIRKARIRQRKGAMKKLAKSPKAYTVKCGLLGSKSEAEANALGTCSYVNKMATQGTPVKHYDKQGKHTGNMVRAFITDIGEVWARVVPIGE
jgi:hypothetical protein